jgi:hypothetical protein
VASTISGSAEEERARNSRRGRGSEAKGSHWWEERRRKGGEEKRGEEEGREGKEGARSPAIALSQGMR